jgi:predicted nucleic acid-binding protein
MSGRVFFDTTILIYAVSEGDERTSTAERLLAAGGSLSVQVLNEFAAVAKRKLKMSWSQIADVLDAARALCDPPLPLTVETHEAALRVATRYGYHIYDSLIIAAALDAGCHILYSEDMQDGQQIDSLTIRNPFSLNRLPAR